MNNNKQHLTTIFNHVPD